MDKFQVKFNVFVDQEPGVIADEVELEVALDIILLLKKFSNVGIYCEGKCLWDTGKDSKKYWKRQPLPIATSKTKELIMNRKKKNIDSITPLWLLYRLAVG